MGINKVNYGNTTLIDTSNVTVTADKLAEGYTALDNSGALITGTYSGDTPTLQSKTYNVSSAGTATVTADSGYDGLSSVAVSVPQADPWVAYDYGYIGSGSNLKWQANALVEISVDAGDTEGWLPDGYNKSSETVVFNAIPSNTTVTPTESAQTIGGENTMMEDAVTVAAIPSNYVGSGITRRSSTDLTASGATVTVPSGYYSAQASKAVASGTAGTPTATKVVDTDDASALITPSVTNTAGYITGGTKTGTSFYVTARELVSGHTLTCDEAGNWDVAELETFVVPSGTAGTPTATKGTVSNHSVSVTPSVTNTTGWITGSTKTGTAVTVSASELVSGSQTVTTNDTYDVTNLAELVVDVSGGSVTWVTEYDGNATIVADSPNYVAINNWAPTHPTFVDGQTWRVTWNGTQYICPVEIGSDPLQTRFIGNKGLVGYTDDSNEPFFGYMRTSTQLTFVTTDAAGTITLKMELQQSSSATLIEKTITANGTYDAEDDDADGYSQVTVNVSSGASNFVTGTFTTGATTNTTGTFTIPYTGTGYPIMLVVVIEGGMYNSSSDGNTTWYNSTQRYAVGEFVITKARTTSAPTYETSGGANYGVVLSVYKNSTSSATTYGRALSTTANSYSSSDATSSNILTVRFKGNGKTVSYYIGYYTSSNSYAYGLMANTTYRYWAVYSS